MKNQLNKTKAIETQTSARPISTLALALVAALTLAGPLFAGKTPPGHSSGYGMSLAAWEDLYWRWAYGDVSIPSDSNGNAVVGENVVLMPLPNAPGDGTPGSIDVTLNTGQPFILPLWALVGTSYSDGTPPDPTVDVNVFRTLDITFKIDGVTVINNANVMNYYTGFFFDPAFPLDFPPVNAVISGFAVGLPAGQRSHLVPRHRPHARAADARYAHDDAGREEY